MYFACCYYLRLSLFLFWGKKILMIDFTVLHYIPIAYKWFHQKKKSFLYCYLQGFVLFCWGCETNKKAARMWTWARARVRRTFSFSFMIVLCHEMMYAATNTIWHIKRMMMMYLPKVTLYCSNFMFFLAQWSRVKSLFYFIVLWNNATVLWR